MTAVVVGRQISQPLQSFDDFVNAVIWTFLSPLPLLFAKRRLSIAWRRSGVDRCKYSDQPSRLITQIEWLGKIKKPSAEFRVFN